MESMEVACAMGQGGTVGNVRSMVCRGKCADVDGCADDSAAVSSDQLSGKS